MLYTWEEWEEEDNILRGGKNPIIHTSAFQYVTVWHSKLMPVCFYSAFPRIGRCCCHGAFEYFMPPPTFMQPANDSEISIHFANQSAVPLPSHVEELGLLICSPRFSAWLINKCPCNFAQLVSHSSHRLSGEEKHIPFWCTSEGTQTPHQVVLISSQPPLQRCMPMTSIIRPHGCWLTHSRLAPLSSAPRASLATPLHHLAALLSPLPVLPLSPMSIPLPSPPLTLLQPPPPLLFPHIPAPYSSPPVIRSWRPPAGVNGGENQPWVSGCISSLRCSLASNEDGHCQNPASRCARLTWGHNEQRV